MFVMITKCCMQGEGAHAITLRNIGEATITLTRAIEAAAPIDFWDKVNKATTRCAPLTKCIRLKYTCHVLNSKQLKCLASDASYADDLATDLRLVAPLATS